MAGHQRFYELLWECAKLHEAKNKDYADSVADPLANFRQSEAFNVPAFEGVLVRLSDKWMRLTNIWRKHKRGEEAAVSAETIIDTLKDLANYALIAAVLYEEIKDWY